MRVRAERGADIPRMRIEIGRGQAQAIIEQSSSGSEVVVAGADVVVVAVVVVLVSGGSAASVLSSSAHPAASGTRATNTTVHTRHLIARHGRTVGEGATPPGRLPGMAASDLPATADLCDDHDDEVAILDNVFRSLGGRDQMAGTAVTLKLFEDNSLVREAVAEDGVGKVLVVDAGGSRRRAVVGDQLAATASDNGWSGILVYGAVRDSAILAKTDLAIHALGTNPRKTKKRNLGDRDVDVTFCGATIRSGDWICADLDGVLVADRPRG